MLGQLLDRYEELERSIAEINAEIVRELESCRDPFVKEALELLNSIPGIGDAVAQVIVSEIGVKMEQFASEKHLASWAGMCPGNNESAGKRKSGKTTKGSQYLRAALVQAAWAASRKKGSYLQAQLLSRRQRYQELGGDYFDRQNVERQKVRLIGKLESFGLRVTVEPIEVAA